MVDKVVEKIVNKASVQVNDIVDKATIRLSDHVKDLHQSSISKDAAPQQAVTGATAAIDNGEELQHDAMEIENAAVVTPTPLAMQEDEYDDARLWENDKIYHASRHPWPFMTYVIHLSDYNGFVLAVDENSNPELRRGFDAQPDADSGLRKRCQWYCEDYKGWLCFKNVGTQKYLGIESGNLINNEPVLCVDFDKIGKPTKFCLRREPGGCYMLQVPYGRELLEVNAVDYVDYPPAAALPEKLYLRCKRSDEEDFTKWSFKEVDEKAIDEGRQNLSRIKKTRQGKNQGGCSNNLEARTTAVFLYVAF